MPSVSAKGKCTLAFIILSLKTHYSHQTPQNDVGKLDKIERCFTPSNDVGNCVRMEDCQSLMDLEKKSKLQPRAAYYLEKSSCRTEGLKCCPNKELKKQGTTQSPTSSKDTPVSFPTNRPDKNDTVVSSTARPDRGGVTSTTKPPKKGALTKIDERMKLLPADCGKREVSPLIRKVVGGEPAVLGEYPWIVALGFRNQFIAEAVPLWSCGGSLITATHVITAAHCAQNRRNMIMFLARVGELNLDENKQDGALPEDIPIKNVIVHPNYDRGFIPSSYANDIAIAVLKKSATFSRNVRPICLPVLQNYRNQLFEGQLSHIAGWGSKEFNGPVTLELIRAQLPVVSNTQCKAAYVDAKNAVIDENVICAGIDTGGIDSCQGDSGGPLMAELNETFNLIGVVSYGSGCGKANTPGVYTRTTAFLDWILETIDQQSTR